MSEIKERLLAYIRDNEIDTTTQEISDFLGTEVTPTQKNALLFAARKGMTAEKIDVLDSILDTFHDPSNITTVCLSGRSGAGKTTFAKTLTDYGAARGLEVVVYHSNWVLHLTSHERKVWIDEPRISGDLAEYTRRARQEDWTDLEKVQKHLGMLREGMDVHINDAFEQYEGEKTDEVHIKAPKKGGIVVVDFIFAGSILPLLNGIVYLHVLPETSFDRVRKRDAHKHSFNDIMQRYCERTWSVDRHLREHYPFLIQLDRKFIAVDNSLYERPWIIPPSDYGLITTPFRMPLDSLMVPVKHITT